MEPILIATFSISFVTIILSIIAIWERRVKKISEQIVERRMTDMIKLYNNMTKLNEELEEYGDLLSLLDKKMV